MGLLSFGKKKKIPEMNMDNLNSASSFSPKDLDTGMPSISGSSSSKNINEELFPDSPTLSNQRLPPISELPDSPKERIAPQYVSSPPKKVNRDDNDIASPNYSSLPSDDELEFPEMPSIQESQKYGSHNTDNFDVISDMPNPDFVQQSSSTSNIPIIDSQPSPSSIDNVPKNVSNLPPIVDEVPMKTSSDDEEVPLPPKIFTSEGLSEQEILESIKRNKEKYVPNIKFSSEKIYKEDVVDPRVSEYDPTNPLFINVDLYKSIVHEMDLMKSEVKSCESVLSHLNEIKNAKDREFEKFRTQLENLQRKLIYVDKIIFDK